MLPNLLPNQLASQAETVVNTLRQTVYQYAENIDAAIGVWDCDCNSFVGFVLEALAPDHYYLNSLGRQPAGHSPSNTASSSNRSPLNL